MKTALATALILSCAAVSAATALETTATARDVKEVNTQINVTAQNAVLSAAITKVNKDVLAILRCNKKNMFYKPADATADADGCVGATMSTATTTETVTLPNVLFDSYPGGSSNDKGFNGTSTRVIDLSGMAAQGATSIAVNAARTSFAATQCNGAVALNIANVNASIATQTFTCHYDNSPNRNHTFRWSYDGSTKQLSVAAVSGQVKQKATAEKARLTGITATYTITKTVLKIGNGQ